MSADFSRAADHLASGLVEHADRDGLTGVMRAVFMDRGGHAPGEACPSAQPRDPHFYICQHPDDECTCHLYGHTPNADPPRRPATGDTPVTHEHASGIWCDECHDADVKRIERILEDHAHDLRSDDRDCRCGWRNPMNGTTNAHRKHVAARIAGGAL